MPALPEAAYFTLPPDWVCEILSPSTAAHDRYGKLPVYAKADIPWAWLIDPTERALEVHHLSPRGRWEAELVIRGDVSVRAAPFDAIELDLAALWPDAKR
ncbi:uncharacterized protein CMC5_022550 [Chondromyces crocatus]|uniref:Putative restriction endonuclease domain-containing protein n=2 Tax=Chondromyces crocatus TaxID=52 RepID=A0A0K1EC29_CHOCO|nr:uncharacterized protein CMC5_022550 [Chondromyces crocatus]